MKKQVLTTWLLGLLCPINFIIAQNNTDYILQDNSAYLDTVLANKFHEEQPGLVFKIIKDGKVIKKGKYGLANLDSGEPIDYDTPFYIASLGKTFTSAAILILKQEGKLKLTDRLGQYFPDFPSYKNKITIAHLMNHTSGLPDHFDKFGEDVPFLDNKMVLKFLKNEQLLFEPGTDYSYSNSAYVLLAEIIQKVSKQSFATFLDQHIFRPLKMKKTLVIERPGQLLKNSAKGYSKKDDAYQLNDYTNIYTLGAGGIYSTINDLVKWDQALYSEKILTKESKKLAFSKAKVPNVRTYLAMGWMDESFGPKTKEFQGLSYVMSMGILKGFRARLMRFTDFNLSIIALSNSGDMHLWGPDYARAFFVKRY